MNLQKLLGYLRKAVDDYSMIENGDRIAVGVSGGKDSLSLLIALKEMQRFYPKLYELEAVTVSLGFPGFDLSCVDTFCQRIGVRYTVVETEIGQIVFDERKEKNPCSLCSKMRKGALHIEAEKLGCNKIALGHTKDDTIETFFLSLFYESRIHTFSPVTYLDRMGLYAVRPLVYVSERDIISFAKQNNLPVVKNPCTVDGYTRRETVKNFISEQNMRFDNMDERVFGALQRFLWKKE